MALLIGYGAAAVNPYLAFETIEDEIRTGVIEGVTPRKAVRNYIKACGKGVLKVMSKMGISTVASYTGAQVFEAIGLGAELVDEYFTGTVSRLGGIGLDEIAAEVAARFGASVGHFHTRPVGPHPRGSVQLTVAPDRFGEVACWLPLHRRGLTVFAHPSTGDDRSDHTTHVIWFGASEPLDTRMFDRKQQA